LPGHERRRMLVRLPSVRRSRCQLCLYTRV
jgi:hypothetical protein